MDHKPVTPQPTAHEALSLHDFSQEAMPELLVRPSSGWLMMLVMVLMFGFVILALLGGCAMVPSHPAAKDIVTFVVLGAEGQPVARAITAAATCPAIVLDDQAQAMSVRAQAQTLAQRPTLSSLTDSKPSAFPVLICETRIPAGVKTASIAGRALHLPKAAITRIVVIGDTGCRIKNADHAYQACNDPAKYPYAQVAAQAAAWHPDLVIHVGDAVYRENACPVGNVGCAGSPWGYGWDAWQADFFGPGRVLLDAAPWAVARGNHESCLRAGQGWWRFLDPQPLQAGQDCNEAVNDVIGDYTDPYAIPLGGDAQLIMLDTANTTGKPIPEGDIRATKYREMYQKMDALSQHASYNIGVNHHPILGFGAKQNADGSVALLPGNVGLQSVLTRINPLLLPPRVNAMLSGHIHVWQEVSFSSPHPTQFIAGFSGTEEDTVPLPATLPVGATPAIGAVVDHISSWVSGFGYMTMERTDLSANQWLVKVWDRSGKEMNTCHIEGKNSVCDIGQVQGQ
jgi:hypothetical protein